MTLDDKIDSWESEYWDHEATGIVDRIKNGPPQSTQVGPLLITGINPVRWEILAHEYDEAILAIAAGALCINGFRAECSPIFLGGKHQVDIESARWNDEEAGAVLFNTVRAVVGIYDADKLIAMRLDAMKKKTAEAVAPAAS